MPPDSDDAPVPFPYNMLRDDPERYRRWQAQVGPAEAARLMEEAAREYMEVNGPRSVLTLGEIMENATARLEEFTI